MSEAQLERLHAGLLKLAALDEPVLAALVEQVLERDELARARSPRA
jgi:UDP:flavonoid glycosyltransferase YjiC (YdhE family)